jgi:hypothetical protein
LGGSSGGTISDSRDPVTTADAKWANAIYLPVANAKARNDQPSAGRNVTNSSRPKDPAEVKAYVEKGGSGKACSGRVAVGSCASISDPTDQFCTALRIAVEDQADRGYAFGGKVIDSSKGGVDCSGFVHAVRNITEWLISTDANEGRAWGIPNHDGHKWTDMTTHSSSAYSAKSKEGNWKNIAGDDDADHYASGMGWASWRPGDEITYASKNSTPDFAKDRRNNISHVLCVFTDPEGNLRVAESGGGYAGSGSMPAEAYYNKFLQSARHWVFERFECSAMWTGDKARTTPWSPSMLGEEYFSAPNMAAQASGEEVPQEQEVEGVGATDGHAPTSTEAPTSTTETEEATSAEESGTDTPPTASTTSADCTPAGTTGSDATTSEDGTSAAEEEASGAAASTASTEASAEECENALNLALEEIGGDATRMTITGQQALSVALNDVEIATVNGIIRVSDAARAATPSIELASTTAGARYLEQVGSVKTSYSTCPPTLPSGTPAATETAEAASTTPASETTDSSTSTSSTTPATPAGCSSAAGSTSPPATPAPAPSGGCDHGGSSGGSYSPGGAYSVGSDRTGAPLGDVPFVGHLGEIRTNPKMNLVDVAMDKTRQPTASGHPYYASKINVREDVAENFFEMKRIMNSLGAVMASSGAKRSLTAEVSAGRIATSFHYTSLAFDFVLPAMMANPNEDEFVIEFDPQDSKQFIFWARSDKTSGSETKGGVTFEVEHKTLNAIVSKSGAPPGTEPVDGYWVNVTKLMRAHGMERISGRSSWYTNCSGHSEAWHFDMRMNAGLVVGETTFGNVLETIYDAGTISGTPPADSAHKTWRGGGF